MKHLVLSLTVLALVGAAWAQYETVHFGADSEYEGIVEQMYNNLSFAPELRIGNNSSAGDWEQAQHDFRAGTAPYGAYRNIGTTAHRTWQSGVVFDWRVSYDASTGDVVWETKYASEANWLQTTASTDPAVRTFTDVFFRSRCVPSDSNMRRWRMYDIAISINGGPAVSVNDELFVDTPNTPQMNYLWIKGVNVGANDTFLMTGKGLVQWTGATPNASNLAMQIKLTKISDRRDYGDTPASYPAAWMMNIGYYNPANHYWFYLGDNLNTTPSTPEIDSESANQPSVGADADDINGSVTDDEDGITFLDMSNNVLDISTFQFVPGTTYQVQINAYIRQYVAGLPIYVGGWIDYSQNSSFLDAGESIIDVTDPVNQFVSQAPGDAGFGSSSKPPLQTKTIQFTIPNGTGAGTTYARFILSSDSNTGPHGPASGAAQPGGEVEDYKLIIYQETLFDWGDLPDTGIGTGTGDYQTMMNDNGARHQIAPGLRMGIAVDDESNGQPNSAADGDDTTGSTPDDEDGVIVSDLNFVEGQAATVRVYATNTTGAAANLYGFVDWNKDGDFLDAGETAGIAVPTGSVNAMFTLNFGTVPQGAVGTTYARFRLSSDPAAANAFGLAAGGEIEDYPANILDDANLDFGDLPDTGAGIGSGNYETLLANDGPRHGIVAGLRMGALVDAELNGFNTPNAYGDDLNNSDDEDGVFLADLTMSEGSPAKVRVTVTNTSGSAATLYGFIDFNNNGSLTDVLEMASVSVPNGSNNTLVVLDFGTVPSGAAGTRYARFRLSTDASAAQPTGLALNGEVEDYKVIVLEEGGIDWSDNPDTGIGTGQDNYNTLANDFGPRHAITPATLRMGALVDAELNGFNTPNADGDDANNQDDEDGVVMPAQLALNSQPGISVQVFNTTGQPAVLSGWIDFNRNGVFDAGERVSATVPNNTNGWVVLNFPNSGSNAGSTYARFRISTYDADNDGHLEPTGALLDGEVEDYKVELIENTGSSDFGDAPTSYGSAGHTSLNNNLQMRPDGGVNVDGEALSYYSANAHGDNSFDASDDENGVASFPPLKTTNTTYSVTTAVFNNSGSQVTLVAWIDFNRDGVFSAGEGVLVTVPSSSSVQNVAVNWSGLSGLVSGPTFARFRLAPTGSGLTTGTPSGIVVGGEAEDYPLNIEDPIAVELSSFRATLREAGVVVEWQAISAVNVAGYHLRRSASEDGDYARLTESMIPVSKQNRYEYPDHAGRGGYFYKLEEISLDGYSRFYGPISVNSATEVTIELPTEFELAQNYPNPFNPTTAISYSLPEATDVTIVVYDLSGRLVRTLVSGMQPAGRHTAVWDAKSDDGAQVSSGVYIYRIIAGEFSKTLKMTLLK